MAGMLSGADVLNANSVTIMFHICSHGAMTRIANPQPPILDSHLAHSIATWVQHAPRRVLLELADSEAREGAAEALGEIIVAEMTMAYPEFVESVEPPLPF